jgi:hypothetical protein
MLWKRSKQKWGMKRGRDEKSNMPKVEEGQKMKCEITTGLFSG